MSPGAMRPASEDAFKLKAADLVDGLGRARDPSTRSATLAEVVFPLKRGFPDAARHRISTGREKPFDLWRDGLCRVSDPEERVFQEI